MASNTKTVYRAMCQDEYMETVKNKEAVFHKRFKWFTENLDFIRNRVKDGKFNNSHIVKDRYDIVVKFEADISKALRLNENELQFDRRRNPKIRMIGIVHD